MQISFTHTLVLSAVFYLALNSATPATDLPLSSPVKSSSHYPAVLSKYVNDYAGVLKGSESQILHNRLSRLEKETGVEGTVVTIDSTKDYGAVSLEKFATGLFNHWGVGDKALNNGFMILVSIRDREFRIELGDGYGEKHNAQMKKIAKETLPPFFKAGEYGAGLRAAVSDVSEALTGWTWREWTIQIATMLVGYYFLVHRRGGLRKVFENRGSGGSGGFSGGRSSGRGGASGSW